MKCLATFDTFGTRRSSSFVPASYVSVITVNFNQEFRTHEICKRNIISKDGTLSIGATMYPYDADRYKDDHEYSTLARDQVRSLKILQFSFRCVGDRGVIEQLESYYSDLVGKNPRDISAKNIENRIKELDLTSLKTVFSKKDHFSDEEGKAYQKEEISYVYFDSIILNAEKERRDSGEAPRCSDDFYAWMEKHSTNAKTLDRGKAAGRDMVRIVKDYFLNNAWPYTRQLELPEFYFRPDREDIGEPEFNTDVINSMALDIARRDKALPCEFVNRPCVLSSIDCDEGTKTLKLGFSIVTERPSDTPGDMEYVVSESHFFKSYPLLNGQEILIEVCNICAGDKVDPECVIQRSDRVLRTIPHDPALSNIETLENKIGTSAKNWLVSQIINKHTPHIDNQRAFSSSIISKLPGDGSGKGGEWYVRNKPHVIKVDTSMDAICGSQNQFVRFDLLHHPFSIGYQNNNGPNRYILEDDQNAVQSSEKLNIRFVEQS